MDSLLSAEHVVRGYRVVRRPVKVLVEEICLGLTVGEY